MWKAGRECVLCGWVLCKIENWKPCCNLEPYQLAIHVLIYETQHTLVDTHTHTQSKTHDWSPFSFPLLPESLNCHIKHTHRHSLEMLFGCVITISSVVEWQVKGVEFRKLRFITSWHAHACALAKRMQCFVIGVRAVTGKHPGIRNEWAEKIITALSVAAGRERRDCHTSNSLGCLSDTKWLPGSDWMQACLQARHHVNAIKGTWLIYQVMCFIVNEFSEYLQLELPSRGTSAIQSCTYYQCLIGDTLNCYMTVLCLWFNCSHFNIDFIGDLILFDVHH